MLAQVDKYEKGFIYITIGVLVVFFIAVILSISEAGAHLPTDEGQIDPREVTQTAPFDNPGVFEVGDGEYQVVMIARAWGFEPSEVNVPAGSEVEFIVTAQDVLHGFMIPRTPVNAMVIPGQITKLTYTFDGPGEHTIVCHEFFVIAPNGRAGHHTMFGKVVVEG